MIREVDLQEISDGKLYTANDLVKAGCNDCAGCSACCRGMGNSIVLDPLDMHRLVRGFPAAGGSIVPGAGAARGGRSDPAQPENGGSGGSLCLFK